MITVSEQRNEFTIVTADGPCCSSGRIGGIDDSCIIVETAQPALDITLDVRRVRRAPVCACSRVAKQMKGCTSKRVTSLKRFPASRIEQNAGFLKFVARLRHDLGAARCQR